MEDSIEPHELPNDSPEPTSESLQSEMEALVSLQNRKTQLTQEREALKQKKSELASSIERLSETLAHYKDQQLQYEAKQKLEYYLHQNTHEFEKLTNSDKNASFVVENLDVLPSRDPLLRLELIGKLYPTLHIENQSILSVVEGTSQYNLISYTVFGDNLPPLQIELLSRDEAVHQVKIVNLEDAVQILRKISLTYATALQTYYTSQGRVDLVMYSYHSLAQLQAEKIKAFSAILRKYHATVTRPHLTWVQDPNHALMCLDYIELSFTDQATQNKFQVRLRWDLALASRVTGEMESKFEFIVLREGAGLLQKTNLVFLTLAATHGVEKAFHVLIGNLFGQTAPEAVTKSLT